MNIQWKYPHEHPLPEEVPPEFSIDAPALGAAASAPTTRQFYWRRLQQVWYVPETWSQKYEWNWSWASDPLNSASQWLKETANRMFSAM